MMRQLSRFELLGQYFILFCSFCISGSLNFEGGFGTQFEKIDIYGILHLLFLSLLLLVFLLSEETQIAHSSFYHQNQMCRSRIEKLTNIYTYFLFAYLQYLLISWSYLDSYSTFYQSFIIPFHLHHSIIFIWPACFLHPPLEPHQLHSLSQEHGFQPSPWVQQLTASQFFRMSTYFIWFLLMSCTCFILVAAKEYKGDTTCL